MRLVVASAPSLVLASALACANNPYYVPPPAATEGDATTTTTTTTTSEATSTAPLTDTSETTGTSEPMTTGMTTSTSTGPDTDTDGSTTDGGCVKEMMLVFQGPGQIEDAFFATNPMKSYCMLPEVSDQGQACDILNLGAIEAAKLQRLGSGEESLFALRFLVDLAEVIESITSQGKPILGAKLSVTLYDATDEDVDLTVGVIFGSDNWSAGDGYGTIAMGDEASFYDRINGFTAALWTNDDGPRGASQDLCDFVIPAGDFYDHPRYTVCDLGPLQVDAIAASQGIVLAFAKGPTPIAGPVIKATDAAEEYQPSLEVYYCAD